MAFALPRRVVEQVRLTDPYIPAPRPPSHDPGEFGPQFDPYSDANMTSPYAGPPSSFNDPRASNLRESGRRALGLINPLSEDSVWGSFAEPDAHPVVQELARPSNYIGVGGGARGLLRGALSGVGGRYGGEAVYEATEGAPEPVRIAGALAGGLLGGGGGYAGARAVESAAPAVGRYGRDVGRALNAPQPLRPGEATMGASFVPGIGPDEIAEIIARKKAEGLTAQQLMADPEYQAALGTVFRPDYNAAQSGPVGADDTAKYMQRARVQDAQRAAEPPVVAQEPDPFARFEGRTGESAAPASITPARQAEILAAAQRKAQPVAAQVVSQTVAPRPTPKHGELWVDVTSLANAEARGRDGSPIRERIARYITPEDAASVRGKITRDREEWLAGRLNLGSNGSAATESAVAEEFDRALRALDELSPVETTARRTPEKLAAPVDRATQRREITMRANALTAEIDETPAAWAEQRQRLMADRKAAQAEMAAFDATAKGDTLGGRIIPPNPIPMIREAFGGGKAAPDPGMFPGMELPAPKRPTSDIVSDIATFSMSAQSTYDASAPGRQLAPFLYGHPTRIWPTLKAQFGNFRGETFEAAQQRLRDAPHAVYRDLAGVDLGDLGLDLTKREEQIGSVLAEKVLPYSKNFNQGYTMAINESRDWLFKRMLDATEPSLLTEAGLRNGGLKELQRIGGLVNASTGRGSDLGGILSQNKVLGIPAFWAPRLLSGRVQLVTSMFSPSAAVRKEAARQVISFVGVNMAIATLAAKSGVADVELDPRSSDFGQIRVGQRRFDLWAGYRPIVNLVTRLGYGMYGKPNMKVADKGDRDGELYSKGNLAVLGRFVRTKYSPPAGELASQYFNRDLGNDKPTDSRGGRAGHAAYNLAAPSLFLKSLIEELRETVPEGYESGGAAGAAKAAGISTIANVPYFLGTGGGYYEDEPPAASGGPQPRGLQPSQPRQPQRQPSR